MSGIMAIVSLDGRPVPPELSRAQIAAIAHRGEWEPRLWEAPGVALGHVNLPRTPEAERELLPMSDRTGRYWLTWDGRLDNRDELAPKLGYDVTERAEKTDADYVLDAFIKWGNDCVHHLLGDWAVVIWDNEARRLFCAKDPLGWRQLYYAEHEGLLAVGSEPQQFFAEGWLPKVANQEYVLRFLAHAEREGTETYYRRIFELQGGNTLWHADAILASQFWRAPRRTRRRYVRPESYVEEFESLVAQAVAARLRSNGKLGVLLSGGLDSSYVAAVAAAQHPTLAGYVIFVPGTRHLDERDHARHVAQHLGIELTEVDTTTSWYLSSRWLPDNVFDQPRMPGAAASLRAVAAAARSDGRQILLGGEGGDEWLDGGTWTASRYRCLADALIHLRLTTSWQLAGRFSRQHSRFKHGAAALIDDAVPFGIARRLRERLVRPVDPWLSPFVDAPASWQPWGRRDRTTVWSDRLSRERMFHLYRSIVLDEIGWRDRNVFAHNGLENRSPFNDLRVVEFLYSVPQWVKRFDGRNRAILRAALRKRGLERISDRTDKGFYNEQLLVGLATRERERFSRGWERVTALPTIRVQNLQDQVSEWLDRPRMPGREFHEVATAGIWLDQVHPQTRGHANPSLHSALREEVITA